MSDEEMKKEIDRILKEAKEEIARAGAMAEKRVERFVEMFRKAAALVLPRDAVEILRQGGLLFTKDVVIDHPGAVELRVSGQGLLYDEQGPFVKTSGRYKLILILEKEK